MPAGVVLDTSFLITLAGPQRSNFKAAREYWKHFIENGIPIFLPTIAISEFYINQELLPEILRACVVLPFNWEDAVMAASINFKKVRRGKESRSELKDDVKIMAQAIVKDAAWIVTDDASTLYKLGVRLKDEGRSKVSAIKLDDGYDRSRLNPTGQRELYNQDSEADAEE